MVSVVAIIAAYNEADVIHHVVRDLIEQGVRVYFLDDGSTDGTVAAVEPFVGRGVLAIETLDAPPGNGAVRPFAWERILQRKAQLAAELDADWFIHHDADEFRESPWPYLSLADAIRRVDALGFNAIDFAGLDFWPTGETFRPGDDVRKAFPFYTERAPYDRVQVRAWKKTGAVVDLASSGGHDVQFSNRNVFPVRFVLRHYPIRGQAHGERKVFTERRNRFVEAERARGWHVQYDAAAPGDSFLRNPSTLTRYDPDAIRIRLAIRHRGVEALEAQLEESRVRIDAQREALEAEQQRVVRTNAELEARRRDIDAQRREVEGLKRELEAHYRALDAAHVDLRAKCADLDSHRAEIERLRLAIEERDADIDRWRQAVDEGARRLTEFRRSLSWRLTAPVRAAYALLLKR